MTAGASKERPLDDPIRIPTPMEWASRNHDSRALTVQKHLGFYKQEAGSKEIVLKDDDPCATQMMLEFIYEEDYVFSTELQKKYKKSNNYALADVGVYKVADKYDGPVLQELVSARF
ncbi:hypothetical protein K469DRAFT_799215 [Zopfia rhizophila CBS 207.26]|uniref:BTB domain-containing protein n=1 Tax=Zopfia rhizophila CBS 207.26 TaxID=1314779 RepID=A0A6A6DJV7_9PEZI|nr:hypothetical protein K469DRAFT_799215 [Zopfia rhizophila CBS 207.26]